MTTIVERANENSLGLALRKDLTHFWTNHSELAYAGAKAAVKIGKLFTIPYMNEKTPLLATFAVLKAGDDTSKIKKVLNKTIQHLEEFCFAISPLLDNSASVEWKNVAMSVANICNDVFVVIMWVSDHPACYLFSVTPVLQMTAGVGLGVTALLRSCIESGEINGGFVKKAVAIAFVTITKGKMIGKAITISGICLDERNLKLAQIASDVAVGVFMHRASGKSTKFFPQTYRYFTGNADGA